MLVRGPQRLSPSMDHGNSFNRPCIVVNLQMNERSSKGAAGTRINGTQELKKMIQRLKNHVDKPRFLLEMTQKMRAKVKDERSSNKMYRLLELIC